MSSLKWWLVFLLSLSEVAYGQMSSSPFQLPGWWGSYDYVLTYRKKRYFPAMVTTSPQGTAANVAGILGESTTSVVEGDRRYGTSPQSGLFVDMGVWGGPAIGAGVSVMFAGQEKIQWTHYSNGNPIVAIPFINGQTDAQSALLVAFPGTSVGGTDMRGKNRFWYYDLYGRYKRFDGRWLRVTMSGGYLQFNLTDALDIYTTATDTSGDITRDTDNFNCRNDYYSGFFGVEGLLKGPFWRISASGKVAFGNLVRRTIISGETQVISGGTTTIFDNGIYAQGSNIGQYTEKGISICSFVDGMLRLTFGHVQSDIGYFGIYIPNPALAPNMLDVTINTSQADGGTLSGPARPTYGFRKEWFWLQGVKAGFHVTY